MKRFKKMSGSLILSLLLFVSFSAFAQLPAFNFSVTATPQTCLNNGVLNFTVSGLQPGAGVSYAVYLLPNTTTAVVTTTNTTVPGLGAGNYTIIATQSLNGQTSTNTQNVTINNLIVPLAYTLAHTKVKCGNDGAITVTVTSGNAVTYEILTGPVTKPPQASNTFTGLPPGLYSVRVYDNCGEAVVTSITVTQAVPGFIIEPMGINEQLQSCNLIGVNHEFTDQPGQDIFYPLTTQYTVFPPGGGAPIVITEIITGGSPSHDIPFYNNQQYSYNLKITDACGNVFTRNNNIIYEKFDVIVVPKTEGCEDNYFQLEPKIFMPPYTVNFTAFPPGFNPSALNINHPTFSAPIIIYGGPDIGLYAPDGNYTMQVTDACNRVVVVNFVMEDPGPLPPQVFGTDASCGNNGIVTIKFEFVDVANVVITQGPPEYGPYPKIVNSYIDENGVYKAEDLPPGNYVFTVTDECGNVYPVTQSIMGSAGVANLTMVQRPGCLPGYGSVRISNLLPITDFIITAAPAAFTEPLPYDVSSNINANGMFYMNSLPAGNYTVVVTNSCGLEITRDITVTGYTQTDNYQVIPHCGSFDLNVQHVSNGTYLAGYFLQKYNPVTGGWEHPQTGAPYTEGTFINGTNALVLANNALNISLAFTGDFRIMKTFYVYSNESVANERCIQQLHTFSFDDAPIINDAFSFPCANGLNEVAISAEGVAPLAYAVTSKDGLPFFLNNGQSSLFSGLESATYNFMVTDNCGNVRNILLDIDALDPLAIKAEGFCEGQDSKLFIQEFDFLEYKWYKEGAPNVTLSTTGTLDFPDYDSATDAGVYHLIITTDNPLSCMNQELSYSLLQNAQPDAGADITAAICNDGENVDLKSFLADGILTTGSWEDIDSTGQLNNSTLTIAGLAEGTYQFRYTVTGLCNLADEAILALEVKNIPQAPVINANAPICEGGEIQLSATLVAPGAAYQWSGPDGFSSAEASPVISNVAAVAAGTYSLAVTVNGCTSQSAIVDVTVNAAPKAGEDATVPLCNEGEVLNLSDYLSGAFDTGGVWEDVDSAGGLTGSNFATEGIAGGTYQFRYTVTNVCNDTDDAVISIQLKDIPQAPSLAPVAPVCEGNDVQLSAETIADALYQWTGPNGFTSNEQNPLIQAAAIAASGNYQVTATVNGCTSASAMVPVTVNVLPQFTVDGNTVLCEGQSSSLTVVPDNFGPTASYQWYFEGDLLPESQNMLVITQTGSYEVVVTNNGCAASREIEVEVNDNAFEVVLDSGCVNYDYMLWVANLADIQGAVVTWTGPANFSFTGPEANITNKAEGEYTATVTNSEGCTAVASIQLDNTSCIVPKGVSPNGDGLNDSFDLSNLEVDELKIFNRYGLKVYEAQNYRKEWYGQSDKGTLPTGTYYYVITLSSGKQVTGWVYLQREE